LPDRPPEDTGRNTQIRSLFPRSADAAAESARNHRLCFDENTPQGLLDLFAGEALAQ